MATQLTYARISKLTKPGRYFDGGSGLHLLIKKTVNKYWVFRFKLNGKRQDMGLGVGRVISVAQHEAKPLITSESLALQYKSETGNSCSAKTIANALIGAGAQKIKKMARFSNGARTQLFTLGDLVDYVDMTDSELGDAFHAQLFASHEGALH